MARPAEKCGHTIICPPNPFGIIHLLTCLARVFQRSDYCKLESFLEFSPTLPKFEASLP